LSIVCCRNRRGQNARGRLPFTSIKRTARLYLKIPDKDHDEVDDIADAEKPAVRSQRTPVRRMLKNVKIAEIINKFD
jgi:hypothetical protein